MATVKPFQPYRYTSKAGDPANLVTQPYDKISPAMQAKYPYLKLLALDNPDLKVYTYPHLVVWPEFDKACADALAGIVSGQVPVQQGLDDLNTKLDAILAKEPHS